MKKIDLSIYSEKYTNKLFEVSFKQNISPEVRDNLLISKEYQMVFLTPAISKESEREIIEIIKTGIVDDINFDIHIADETFGDNVHTSVSALEEELDMINEHDIVAQL